MRIGVRPALTLFVLCTIALTSGLVHALWWRTAQADSRMLATTLNQQIVGAVKKEVASLIGSARAAHGAIRTIFVQNVIDTREADKREFVFLAQLQAQPALSWIAFGWPDGSFFAAHKLGDAELEMMEITAAKPKERRVDRYKVLSDDIEFQSRSFEPTDYEVTKQLWYLQAATAPMPAWSEVSHHPVGSRPAIAYAGGIDIYGTRVGVLAVMIDLDRLSRFLASLSVGRTGAAFVLRPNGLAAAVPDPQADEVHGTMLRDPTLLAVARKTHQDMLAKATPHDNTVNEARVIYDGVAYAVTVTPLDFMGWEVTTVIPEAEFFGEIDRTNRRLTLVLAGLILAAVVASTLLARALLARPLAGIAAELAHVQRFELEAIRRHPSRLKELDDLSRVIASMATGLSAFRKYLPADLVRTLIAEGVEARPGGTIQPLTIMFADIAGFTGLSERLGNAVVPLLARYIDLMSGEIDAHGGTIDKFIGDAVMAFWGAPAASASRGLDACRTAVACGRALARAGLVDDRGQPLRVRIGINTGNVLVGNIGSDRRLNYTAIGDAVNVASRLESANKIYGTEVIIGETTRREAGAAILVREIDRVALYGRTEGIAIFELIGLAGPASERADWVATYEAGLAAYRARRFSEAIGHFEQVIRARGADGPAIVMMERCQAFLASPPPAEWCGTSVLDGKT